MGASRGHEFGGDAYPLVHVGRPDSEEPGEVHALAERHARRWALACHLSPLAAWALGLPGLLGPLLIWLLKRNDVPAVAVHGREALNFQITLVIAQVGLAVFTVVTLGFGVIVAAPLLLGISIGGFVVMVIAAIRASEGRVYRYPLTLRLV